MYRPIVCRQTYRESALEWHKGFPLGLQWMCRESHSVLPVHFHVRCTRDSFCLSWASLACHCAGRSRCTHRLPDVEQRAGGPQNLLPHFRIAPLPLPLGPLCPCCGIRTRRRGAPGGPFPTRGLLCRHTSGIRRGSHPCGRHQNHCQAQAEASESASAPKFVAWEPSHCRDRSPAGASLPWGCSQHRATGTQGRGGWGGTGVSPVGGSRARGFPQAQEE